jgi:hypothetical protein
MYSRNTKTTNETTASNNKSDRPQVKICDTNSVVEKINGMAYIFTLLMFRKPNKTTINKKKTTNF